MVSSRWTATLAGALRAPGHKAWPALLVVLMIVLGCLRVVSTYRVFWQTWDEPFTIAAGMEWLERGQYTYERFHPPLARVMAALGPHLRGVTGIEAAASPWEEGNTLLHAAGAYERNLASARLGMLPFFIVASIVVALWARRMGGWPAALAAVFLVTTLPAILGHSGTAGLDMACAAFVAAALFAFVSWLARPDGARSILLGCCTGLAVVSKFSAAAFLVVSGSAILALWRAGAPRKLATDMAPTPDRRRLKQAAALVLLVCGLTIWSGYRFSVAPLASPEDRPHGLVDRIAGANGAAHEVAYRLVETVPVPAPEFWAGLSGFFHREHRGHLAYLLGQVGRQGWWYYFPVLLAVKTPLPFLLLAAFGLAFIAREVARTRAAFPLAVAPIAALGVLSVGMLGSVNNGLRQILSIYPLLAIMAGYGVPRLASWRWQAHRVGLWLAVALCGWQLISSAAAHPDYLAYFNALAGEHPENIVVDGDLDWGQDLKRLAQVLETRGITELSIDYNGSLGIDLARFPLPRVRQLEPYRKVTGWVAASALSLKLGTGRAPYDQFTWLTAYQPVERVGRSIWLYYIPAD